MTIGKEKRPRLAIFANGSDASSSFSYAERCLRMPILAMRRDNPTLLIRGDCHSHCPFRINDL
jgi:hypothetical protein